jgi:hypothetical protein
VDSPRVVVPHVRPFLTPPYGYAWLTRGKCRREMAVPPWRGAHLQEHGKLLTLWFLETLAGEQL